jgi:ADP-ribose pyrophosphatase
MAHTPAETRLSGEAVYSGRVVTLEVDRVRLPGGGETLREVVRHRGAAVVLPLLDDGRIVMVRQFRYPVGESLLELPAGTLEPGEEPMRCAARELAEETGYRAGTLSSLGSFYAAPGYTDETLLAVLATELEPTADHRPDHDEQIDLELVAPAELLRRVASGEVRDAKTIATLMLAQLRGVGF